MATGPRACAIATVIAGIALSGGGQGAQLATPTEETLEPDVQSEVTLDRVTVGLERDGRRTLRVQVTSEPGSTFHYYVIADQRASTYRAFAVGDNPFEHPGVRAYLIGRRIELQRTTEWKRYGALLDQAGRDPRLSTIADLQAFMAASEDPPPICEYCHTTCNGSGFSRAITWDPAPVQLTHTNLTLYWSRDDTPRGCEWNARASRSCWATPEAPLPWPFNTHWYVGSCGLYPIDKSEMFALGEASGFFYNDDFGNPFSRTYVTNNAQVVFNGGQVVHGFIFFSWGEAYFLLDATVAGASYNNCYY